MKVPTSCRHVIVFIFTFVGLVVWSCSVNAYVQYSQNGGDATNCGACHGDFRSNQYISPGDGALWGNLHNLHRTTMLSGDCDACHSAGDRFPVFLSSSVGGDGLEPISCAGCHGREGDNTPQSGYSAGLRQHHTSAGVMICGQCHPDANPANFTPVGEDNLPPYYFNPGNGHPNIPGDSCNQDGSEDFAGNADGLDNDGDAVYDGGDTDCSGTATPEELVARAILVQNYPNPFNPVTLIRYSLSSSGWVRLTVYTVTGRLVRTLVDTHHERADSYATNWNGRDEEGNEVASGVYIYRLEAGGHVETKRMVLIQ